MYIPCVRLIYSRIFLSNFLSSIWTQLLCMYRFLASRVFSRVLSRNSQTPSRVWTISTIYSRHQSHCKYCDVVGRPCTPPIPCNPERSPKSTSSPFCDLLSEARRQHWQSRRWSTHRPRRRVKRGRKGAEASSSRQRCSRTRTAHANM
jgi:hypothetical protein